jgi:hypothetical protein
MEASLPNPTRFTKSNPSIEVCLTTSSPKHSIDGKAASNTAAHVIWARISVEKDLRSYLQIPVIAHTKSITIFERVHDEMIMIIHTIN